MIVHIDLGHHECRYLLEHGLRPDGRFDPNISDEVGTRGFYETFFTETGSGKCVPRAIFADLDPSVGHSPTEEMEIILMILGCVANR